MIMVLLLYFKYRSFHLLEIPRHIYAWQNCSDVCDSLQSVFHEQSQKEKCGESANTLAVSSGRVSAVYSAIRSVNSLL